MVGLIACQLQIPLKLGKTWESRENKCIKTEQHGKCQGQYVRNWNQYSKRMHVSIFLRYFVTVLKSLNYACKNLMYAYICMKVYNLAWARQTCTTVGFAQNKRQKQEVKCISLQQWSGGSLQQTLSGTGKQTDGEQSVLPTFLLSPSPLLRCSVRAAFSSLPAYGFPTQSPSPTMIFNWGDFFFPGDIFFFFGTITRKKLLISNGHRSGMVIKSYNAQGSPLS